VLIERDAWGRLVESAVGTHILNSIAGTGIETFYWREGNHEVDFVLRSGDSVVGRSKELSDSLNQSNNFGVVRHEKKPLSNAKLKVTLLECAKDLQERGAAGP
jgi:predicted AAA+ superfamily ATPase